MNLTFLNDPYLEYKIREILLFTTIPIFLVAISMYLISKTTKKKPLLRLLFLLLLILPFLPLFPFF